MRSPVLTEFAKRSKDTTDVLAGYYIAHIEDEGLFDSVTVGDVGARGFDIARVEMFTDAEGRNNYFSWLHVIEPHHSVLQPLRYHQNFLRSPDGPRNQTLQTPAVQRLEILRAIRKRNIMNRHHRLARYKRGNEVLCMQEINRAKCQFPGKDHRNTKYGGGRFQ